MGYSEVDPMIKAWTERHGFTLYDRYEGFPGVPLRLVYLSSSEGECFRIWIDEPKSGQVSIGAADVETRNDEELRQDWSIPVENLGAALEDAVTRVRKWMGRQ
jgi:hypothetical protein